MFCFIEEVERFKKESPLHDDKKLKQNLLHPYKTLCSFIEWFKSNRPVTNGNYIMNMKQ